MKMLEKTNISTVQNPCIEVKFGRKDSNFNQFSLSLKVMKLKVMLLLEKYHKILALMVVATGILTASILRAQDNPYKIDNTCFVFFQQAEELVGKEGFKAANELLLQSALAAGDRKAETLYYVEVLKDLTQYPSTDANDKAVELAQAQLKQIAQQYGFSQYYYYSYQLVQNYYYSNDKIYRTMELVQEMQATAIHEHDQYGLWTGDKYLASLYIEQDDYVSAKPYILRAIHTWHDTTDETVRRQSPTRLYCDLADTYPIGTDSVHINVAKAAKYAKQHLDTVRVTYYQARLNALEGQDAEYRKNRDRFLNDSRFQQVRSYGREFFSLMDAIMDGSVVTRMADVLALPAIREIKVIANICEKRGLKDFAFEVEKGIVNRMEVAISGTNQSRLSELDVSMGKAALSAELDNKETEVAQMSHLLWIVLIVLLLAVLTSAAIYIIILRNRKRIDQQHIQELEEANEKVRLADAAKTRFVQNMSHEVRTPLNAIVGFSQLLSLPDGSLDPAEKEEFSGHIINNTKMLTMLLDDILNASAMDSGNYRITYEQGEKDFMAQAAISSAEHRLQPGVQLLYVPEEAEPFTFTTDPRRVQQILINLITNACKHTQKGEIRVGSSLSAKPGYLTYTITDTGPGIPPEEAEKIFERFTKLNEFVQGTGLGLSICRDIASRMNANVYLDTTYKGEGARFVFEIPTEIKQAQ